jgi:electron transfer flavoprotein beta subunit
VDLILCGKQAIDGDTAQTGPGIATRLGYTQFTYVTEVQDLDEAKGEIQVKRKVEGGFEIIRGPLPALLTVELEMAQPRRASLPLLIHSLRAKVIVWDAQAIQAEPAMIGLKGSPTWVKRIFAPQAKEGGPRFDAQKDARQAVAQGLDAIMADERFAQQLLTGWKQ